MFITNKILDIVVSTKDQSYALALSAFNSAHDLAMGAAQSEIRALKLQVEDLVGQLKYERARADRLVDRLLERDARVAAVAPMAEHVAKHQDAEAVKVLDKIFHSINEVGQDVNIPTEGRAFEMAGGSAVER